MKNFYTKFNSKQRLIVLYLQDFIIKRSHGWSPNHSHVAIATRSSFWWWRRRRATWSRSRQRSYSWKRSRNLPPPSQNHRSSTWSKLGHQRSSSRLESNRDRDWNRKTNRKKPRRDLILRDLFSFFIRIAELSVAANWLIWPWWWEFYFTSWSKEGRAKTRGRSGPALLDSDISTL